MYSHEFFSWFALVKVTAPRYQEVNEEGIRDFKNLVKELQRSKKIAVKKIVNTKAVFEKSVTHPAQLKQLQQPNKLKQEEQIKQSENKLEHTAPVTNSQRE